MDVTKINRGTVCFISSKSNKDSATKIKKVLVYAYSDGSDYMCVMPIMKFSPEHFANTIYISELDEFVVYGNIFTVALNLIYDIKETISRKSVQEITDAVSNILMMDNSFPNNNQHDIKKQKELEAIIAEKDETILSLKKAYETQEETYKKIINSIMEA